ncbi:hypothetical protein AVEN_45267-1, partial [Araneus ventricosus]
MAVNSSHVKGGGEARRRHCIRSLERCREICQATCRRRTRLYIQWMAARIKRSVDNAAFLFSQVRLGNEFLQCGEGK